MNPIAPPAVSSPSPKPVAGADAAVLAAAVLNDGSADVDRLLADVVADQRARGRSVRGLLMTYAEPARQGGADGLVLVDIETRESYLVSQDCGPESKACRADSQGFARASRVLRTALADAPDLVVVNRFGSLESEGEGFATELLDLMAAGVPLLVGLSPRYLDAWRHASGGAAVLPPRREAVDAWLEGALAGRTAA